MNTYFTKKESNVIKGIAIILMLMHHLWRFPDRLYYSGITDNFTIFGQSISLYLGDFGKICVSLFFFISGYGLYTSHTKKPFDIIAKIKNIYLAFWKVFFIFIPIAFMFFSNQPDYAEKVNICHRYATFSWEVFLKNMLGINTQYNGEWWFLISYVGAIVSFPLIRKIADHFSACINVCIVSITNLIFVYMVPLLQEGFHLNGLYNDFIYSSFYMSVPYITCFWMGIVMAKDNLLFLLKERMKDNHILNPISDIVLLITLVFLRTTGIGIIIDFIYVPFLIIISLHLLGYIKWLKITLEYLGKHSTNMWLSHSFFCYYFYPFAKLVLFPKYAVPCLIVLIALSLLTSIMLNHFWHLIYLLEQHIKSIFKRKKNDSE